MKKPDFCAPIAILMLALTNCTNPSSDKSTDTQKTDTLQTTLPQKEVFGTTAEGDTVYNFRLENEGGISMNVITYGGIIQSLKAPDKNGKVEEITVGFKDLADYEAENPFFGALIGRYGNRIAKGKFTLDGTEYTLPINNDPNHLHGGPKGFFKVNWNGEAFENEHGKGVKLTYMSPDGDMGYPGNLLSTVTYLLTPDNTLEITYEAETDKATVVNLTQHAYFNLSGNPDSTILNHELKIMADKFVPVDPTLIPTGKLQDVKGTPFDFTERKKIGADIEAKNTQLERGKGFDHNWVLNNQDGVLALAAELYHAPSGRLMEVLTTEPGIQFYSGNFLDGTLTGRHGGPQNFRTGLCLETQHYPDSPNQPKFPTTVLRPGEKYRSQTIFKFSAK